MATDCEPLDFNALRAISADSATLLSDFTQWVVNTLDFNALREFNRVCASAAPRVTAIKSQPQSIRT